jgi:uncharacterized protein YjgD (DUF1641 family)
MQEENNKESVSEEMLGTVQDEQATIDANVEVEDIVPSTEVLDILPSTDTAIGS